MFKNTPGMETLVNNERRKVIGYVEPTMNNFGDLRVSLKS